MPANAGPYSGNDGQVLSGTNVIAKVTGFEYKETIATRETTVLGDTHDQMAAGLKNVSGTIEALMDRLDTTGQGTLDAGVTVTLVLRHGSSTNDPNVTISALILEKAVVNGSGNDSVKVTFPFHGNTFGEALET